MTQSIEQLKGLLEKATPGPWEAGRVQIVGHCTHDGFRPERETPYDIGGITIRPAGTSKTVCSLSWSAPVSEEVEATAALIVAAVNTLPDLLAERDTLLSQIESDKARRGKMEARIADVRRVIEFGYRRVIEGRTVNPIKNGERCDHGRLECEDCIGCYDEALLEALTGDPT